MRHAGLDVFRLFGAALVLIAHGAYFLYPLLPIYDVWLGIGWIGTEVFFALSGFLVVGMLLQSPPDSRAAGFRFAIARLRRVLPLFWLFVVINVALWWWQHGSVPGRAWAYPLLLQNTWATHPGFFGEAWNLPLLMLFSMVAPLLALWATHRGDSLRALRNALLVLALGGLALRAGLVVALDPEWDLGVRKWLPMRLDACAWGGLVACWYAGQPTSSARAYAALVGLLMLVLSITLFFNLPLTGFTARVALFALMGIACALPLPWLCRGTSAETLTAAARAVFVLYLVNMPLIYISEMIGLKALGALPAFTLWLVVSVAAAIFISRISDARR